MSRQEPQRAGCSPSSGLPELCSCKTGRPGPDQGVLGVLGGGEWEGPTPVLNLLDKETRGELSLPRLTAQPLPTPEL